MDLTRIRRRARAAVDDVRDEFETAVLAAQARGAALIDRLDTLRSSAPGWSLKQALVLVVIVAASAAGFAWFFYDMGWDKRGAQFEAERRTLEARIRAEERALINRLNLELELARRMVEAANQRAAQADERAAKAVEDLLLHSNDPVLSPETIDVVNRMIAEANR
jgi:hypothetical protein